MSRSSVAKAGTGTEVNANTKEEAENGAFAEWQYDTNNFEVEYGDVEVSEVKEMEKLPDRSICFARCLPSDYAEFCYKEFGSDIEKWHPSGETLYRCWQPDSLDNMEFNLIIMLPEGPVLSLSRYFDFICAEI